MKLLDWLILALLLIAGGITTWFYVPVYQCPECGRRTVDEAENGLRKCLYCGKEWQSV